MNIYDLLSGHLSNIDKKTFLMLNQLHHPLIDKIVYWVTHELFWIPLYVLLLYLIIKKQKNNTWLALLAIIILITLCDQFASGLIKPWTQRLRPCCNPHLKEMIHVVGRYHGLYGFISSHAANTFGLAIFLYFLLRKHYKYIYLLFIWAIGVSYARIYGGVHYPLDILVGSITGLGWGWGMYKVYNFTAQHTIKGNITIS